MQEVVKEKAKIILQWNSRKITKHPFRIAWTVVFINLSREMAGNSLENDNTDCIFQDK